MTLKWQHADLFATYRKTARVRHVRAADPLIDSRIWVESNFDEVFNFIVNFCNSKQLTSKYRYVAANSSSLPPYGLRFWLYDLSLILDQRGFFFVFN